MLRKLGYILTSTLLMIGSLATMGNAISMMDTDVSYGDSRTLYFKISDKGSTYKGILPENYIQQTDGYGAVDAVAEEMENRLEAWDINAEVQKEGYDTVRVVVRTAGNDNTEYNYLEDYLSFSGQDITVGAGAPTTDLQAEAPSDTSYFHHKMFEGNKASIEYINNVPVVTIEVNEKGENGKFNELIKFCSDNTKSADEEEGSEAQNCYVVLWNHFQEGDNYIAATNTSADDYDPNMSKRLIFGEAPANAWYVDSTNENNNYTKFQIIPNSEAIANGNYDSSKAGAAYKAALYYSSILNAAEYDYDVTFDYSTTVTASVDSLMAANDWHLRVNMSSTMIAIIVSFVVCGLVLALFYRLGALSIMSNTILSVELGVLLFGYFSAQFGIGALVGFILGALVTSFGGAYYYNKLKEELYKGRSLKKAESEAGKKALWPTVDAGIVAIIIGLCIYGFIPGSVGKLGLSLIWTAAFGTILNLTAGRFLGWMLANDSSSEKHLSKTYFVDENKIPDLLQEEKQTYFGAYAEKDFTKHKRIWGILGGSLLLASIVGLSVFANTSLGILNYSGAYENTTSVSVEYRIGVDSQATKTMATIDNVHESLLDLVEYNGKTLAKYVDGDIVLEQSTVSINDDTEVKMYTVYHFDIPLSIYFDSEKTYDFTINGVSENNYLNVALQNAIDLNADASAITVSGNRVVYQAGTPAMGTIFLALGVSSAILLAYYWLRFRLARALPVIVVALGSSVVVAGFFALTRIAVTPVVTISILSGLFVGAVLSLFLLNKEKELIKDSREKDKNGLEFRNHLLLQANSQIAGDIIVFSLLTIGMALPFIGIAPTIDKVIFLGIALAVLLALVMVLTIVSASAVHLSLGVASLRRSVRDSWNSRTRGKNGKNAVQKKKSSEPEEAVFIGIND